MRKPLPRASPAPPGSLAAALATVPDPRQPFGWRPEYPPIPLVALLQLAVAAILCGARSLYAIAQWGRERLEDDPALLLALGLPPGRSPCVATLHRVCKALDVAAFEQAVGQWLTQTGVRPADPLALDGKTLRGMHGEALPGVQLLAAYAHQAQTVLAQVRVAAQGQEVAAAQEVLSEVPLQDRLVTGDAALTQRNVCTQIVAAGGDYLFPVKENQPQLRADLELAFSPVAGTRSGRHRAAGRPRLGGGGLAGAGGHLDSDDRSRAEGAPWAPGSAPAVAAGGPGAQWLRRQCGQRGCAVAPPGTDRAGGAAPDARAPWPGGQAGGQCGLRHHQCPTRARRCGQAAAGLAGTLGDREQAALGARCHLG